MWHIIVINHRTPHFVSTEGSTYSFALIENNLQWAKFKSSVEV